MVTKLRARRRHYCGALAHELRNFDPFSVTSPGINTVKGSPRFVVISAGQLTIGPLFRLRF